MKKYYLYVALAIVGTLLLLITAFVGGAYVGSNNASHIASPPATTQIQQTTNDQTPETDTTLYTNDAWNFSIQYPSDLEVQEGSNGTVFGHEGDPWIAGYSVGTKNVPFNSTEEWLAAQTKGNFSSEGYELLLWLDSNEKTAIVAEYVEYDRKPDGSYVHGRYFYAVRVDNGILYRFLVSGVQFEERGAPQISLDHLKFVESFRPYVE
jgi:hypothetical protein